MSIATTSTKETYQGNASIVDAYPISFKYLEPTHVKVYFDGVLQQRGAGADYVLSGDGTINTGFITTNVAQPSTVVVTIVLDVPFDQPVELLETGILSADTLEEAFDRLNMQIRRVWRKAQNVLSYSTDEGGTGSTGTADTLLGFDSSGDLGEIPTADFEPAKGADDNFVTDDEKVVIGNTSGINTGDQIVPVTGVDFDPVGTDNSTDVTLAGTANYISLVDQTLTANEITESDVNASINASLDLADTAIQSLAGIEAGDLASTGATVGQVLQSDGDTTCSFVDLVGGGNALTSNPLSQFAATTSAQLAGVISDETGTGALVFATSPTLITPDLGTPSAVDLTNATNIPANSIGTTQIINGSVAKEDLGANVKASLDLADTAIQTAGGTVQGVDAVYDIQAADEGTVAGNARGEWSVDLQTTRNAATEVASGSYSAIVGGARNTANALATFIGGGQDNRALAQYAGVLGGVGNDATGNNSFVMGGYGNTASGARGVVMLGANSTASGIDSMAVGTSTTASHRGARMIGDGTTTAFASKATYEFGVQADNIRLDVGTPAVGDVLTCNHVDGSSSWAAPADSIISTAEYDVIDGNRNTSGILSLRELSDPDGIGSVTGGVVTLAAGSYYITVTGNFTEDNNDLEDYYKLGIRHNGVSGRTYKVSEVTLAFFDFPLILGSDTTQTVDLYATEVGSTVFFWENVKVQIIKL